MRNVVAISLFCLLSFTIYAQNNIYKTIKLGSRQIGVMDTIIFDEKYSYDAFDYKGGKPYFIKIWHPTQSTNESNYIRIEDLYGFKENQKLKTLQDSLKSIYKSLFIRDYLTENLESGHQNNFGKHSLEEVFNFIGKLKTRSTPSILNNKSNLPVIIYYNGSQGHPFENFVLAEYLASRNIIFLSASLELPYEKVPFGLLPYERHHSGEYEESLKTIIKFAQSITNYSDIFFIGHSMGAQMGLRALGQDSIIKGMVSLETTLEFKKDNESIKEMWPELYKKIINEKTDYPFPILFCAATGDKEPFFFLDKVKSSQTTFISTKTDFEHNAYLSLFYLRYFLDSAVPQTDKKIIFDRLLLYQKHLTIIYKFFSSIIKNKNVSQLESKIVR